MGCGSAFDVAKFVAESATINDGARSIRVLAALATIVVYETGRGGGRFWPIPRPTPGTPHAGLRPTPLWVAPVRITRAVFPDRAQFPMGVCYALTSHFQPRTASLPRPMPMHRSVVTTNPGLP